MSSGGWVVGKINAVQPKDYYADAGDLAFSTAYGSVSEKMRIKSNTGNVGIGTASPGEPIAFV